MKIREIQQILEGEILTTPNLLDVEIEGAFASDLMSDVLAYVKGKSVLLTGLNNPQVIRTAEMLDILVIIFVRGKKPSQDLITMAEENGIAIISTCYSLYTACGKLYSHGLMGVKIGRDEAVE